ncbi:TPA: hypothetical protein NKU97_004595 [Vibrio parahaemolyticus]|uniref:hypothetical protein n=1 Tax=Vibrio TaxID=662 RepID=UPI00046EF571|nr:MULTISPECIES: hypothetical protein [Vibrio harveyi group]MBE4221924.1 hypothetical protein [Vibrio parahaemolyticus]MCX8788767.1 hypothetical protein [Vibrio parahaemolyticus]MCX8849976.1 hypothetical protein [Vibrio parahaemolyticus]TOB62036.1 hypothetical protein CGK01_23015 [Vibrio parahaemolyticus]TOP41084.1 hypothetical protein CGH15_22675 [Vibrio parahaemolyticus]
MKPQIISVVKDDKKYVAQYTVSNGIVVVTAMLGSKRTYARTADPKQIAIDILRELISEGKASDML